MKTSFTCLLIGSMLFLFCGKDKAPTVVHNPSITGIIYEPGGIKPAVGAKVKVFLAEGLDSSCTALDTTDNNGRFSIADVAAGIYTVWAEKNFNVLFRDSVRIPNSTYSIVLNDTLECSSTLTGTVRVYACHDPRIVSILIPGSDKRIDVTDEGGRFTITGLASGTYTLLFNALMSEYGKTYKNVAIPPCSEETLDSVKLDYFGFPMVTRIKISQDTLGNAVRLSWDKVDYSSLQDYVIYRDTCRDFNFSNKIIHATKDTFFFDTSYHPPFNTDPWAQHCLEYRVAVRNDLQEIGPTCRSARLSFVTDAYATTYFSHQVKYPNPDPQCDTATINDKIKFWVYARNSTRSLVSLAWCDPHKKDTIVTIDARNLSLRELSDTITLTFDTIGINNPMVIVTDEAGKKWIDVIPVTIIQDPPGCYAGGDTGVLAGTQVHLQGVAFDRFGTINECKWKIGAGTWQKTQGSEIDIIAPSYEGVTRCSLSVTDDDWNTVNDEMLLITTIKAQSVAACSSQSLIVKSDGTLLACGNNDFGQLGDGTVTASETFIPVMSGVQSVAAGCYHSMAITTNGVLWSFGGNAYGQLGTGNKTKQFVPVPVMNDVQNVATGYVHSMVLKKDKTLWAFGWNHYGQLGDGTTESRDTAVYIMSDVQNMAAGMYHSLILKTNGTVWACGENGGGQLGDGTTVDRTVPEQVMSDVQSIAAGSWHSFFLKNDGSLWASGNNGYGQLGDGTLERRMTPVQVMSNVRSVATSPFLSLILGKDGTLWICGFNPFRLQDTTAITWYTPIPISTDVQSMAVGWQHALIIKNNGTVWACGMNFFGQLGNGTRTGYRRPLCVFPPQSVAK
jgi:alpha-tubulin suppressor-like RCC1 family protein